MIRQATSIRRRILFLTGTRADFGKLKALMASARVLEDVEIYIFVTGMHMLKRYGSTWEEVERSSLGRIFMFVNQKPGDSMDGILAKTISGLSDLVKEIEPDLIVVHGDRLEALAGSLVGTFNRIRVAHIEGGEVSGTVDETIRHTVTKLSHVHLVANDEARTRLQQLGEDENTIFMIGSPEVDAMSSPSLPSIADVKEYYEIPFENYFLLVFHPVTTEIDELPKQARLLVDFVLSSENNYLVIWPNNDDGTEFVQREYERLTGIPRIRIVPSMRFEFYLSALKHATLIIGNSSSGVREAPFYGVPTVNLGSRQKNRSKAESVVNSGFSLTEIDRAIQAAMLLDVQPSAHFGDGRSGERFLELLATNAFWTQPLQKTFIDHQIDFGAGRHGTTDVGDVK